MMRGKNDDAARAREDSFLAGLIPQAAEHLAERHAEDFDAKAGRARFETWLAAHTRKPAVPVRSRASAGRFRPAGTGRIKRSRNWLSGAWDAVPVPGGRLLIWLSGAQGEILEECPADRPKYVGIGASILISAALVGVSLAFALVAALNVALWVALPAAVASGAAVLSLNRLFVVSLPRNGRARVQLFRAIPRFLLALLVGLIVSTPLVLQIFAPAIQHQITIQRDQVTQSVVAQISKDPLAKQIADDQATYNVAITALEHAQSPTAAGALKQEVSAAGQKLRADQAALQKQTEAVTATNQENTGLLAKLQALDTAEADNSVLAVARWLLFALFVFIDCMPVMIKVMLNLGPESTYDKMLEAEATTQLQIAERRRAVRLDAEARAAEAAEASARDRMAALQAPLPGIEANIIATRQRVEAEWLRTWEADQIREGAVVPDEDDDDDYSPKGSPVRRYTLSFWRSTAGLAVGVAAVLAFSSGALSVIAIAVVTGVLLVSTLAAVGAILQSADRTDRLVRLLRALRSENPSIAGSRGRYQRSRPQPPVRETRSATASTMTSGSSKTGLSSRGREAGATAKACGSCGSPIGPYDIFCGSCGWEVVA